MSDGVDVYSTHTLCRAEDGAARRDRVRKRAEEAGIAIAALNALIAQQGG